MRYYAKGQINFYNQSGELVVVYPTGDNKDAKNENERVIADEETGKELHYWHKVHNPGFCLNKKELSKTDAGIIADAFIAFINED